MAETGGSGAGDMEAPGVQPTAAARPGTDPGATGRHALLVAAGILASRLFGFVRQHFLARALGLSEAADAFNAAFRIPNFLQNLFGEGVLSASFIPVYARLLADEDEEQATRVAAAIGAILAVATSVLVLAGIAATPLLIDAIAPGFEGAKRELATNLVRILFPGAGLLVLSAWCLGILNSHHRFLLSYASPIAWNVAIVAALLAAPAGADPARLATIAALGSLAGSALQLLVQAPAVVRLLGRVPRSLGRARPQVQGVLRNFLPVFVGRGVVQISAWIDTVIASFLPSGAVAALANAQVLSVLPVSLFGMSVSAAELPAMSRARGDAADVAGQLRSRLDGGLRRIAFLVVPSAMAFLALGDVLASALFEAGRFTRADATWVWGILAGSAVGLLASTLGRLYASTFYALRDTRTPLRFAVLRVVLTIGLGVLFALPLPRLLGIDPKWGAAGLTASAGLAGWVELFLLRRTLDGRIGRTGMPAGFIARLWLAALLAAAVGLLAKTVAAGAPPLLRGAVVAGAFGLAYFAATAMLGLPEGRRLLDRLPLPGRRRAI